MVYYNPTPWIPKEDNLLSNVEDKLRAEKRATSARTRRSRAFLPPYAIELEVTIRETHELLRLTLTKEKLGKISINLAAGEETLRKGHFNHGYHHNPDGRDIQPPHHIHFPTYNYPLLDRQHTYAYPVKADNNYIAALQKLCLDTNINLHDASLPLLGR